MAGKTTASTTPDTAEVTGKYETMIIGVPKARKLTRTGLDELAQKLGCKPSALVWAGIDLILASPPKTAPAGAAASHTGSAAGFWVLHNFEGNKLKSIQVKEVAKRADASGRAFYRYTVGDDKGRVRARNQAIRGAQYDAKVAGLGNDIKTIDLKTPPVAAAA